jgi:Fe-S-cluster-containing dehydrogenase component/CRP-like cAMP-binding protein
MPTIKPPATLEPRPGDEELTIEQLKEIALFETLERPVKLEEFPRTIVLRKYRKGDVLCEQNQPGNTAFYLLTAQDLLELRRGQVRAAEGQPRSDAGLLRQWKKEIEALEAHPADAAPPAVASATVRPPAPRADGLLGGVMRRLDNWLRPAPAPDASDFYEGDIVGEMSCLYRQPRSATVRIERDCYALEFIRHILDKMYGDKKFKARMDKLYRERALDLHLRRIPLFRELGDEQIRALRERAELCELEPGDLLMDEHDRSDSMVIIRMGFIKAVAGASSLLAAGDIADWAKLVAAIKGTTPAHQKFWTLLTEPARAAAEQAAGGGELSGEQKQALVDALNDLLKRPALRATPEFKAVIDANQLADEAKRVPSSAKKWSQHQDVCRFNRKLLAAVLGDVLPPLVTSEETARILGYRARGEPIGEIGLLAGQPRSATCVAYVHHGEGKSIHGRVELVKIDKALFDELRDQSPPLRRAAEAVMAERRRNSEARRSLPVWQESGPAGLSTRFDALGLIQGQHLMLIDLDRCTRCDQCVEACVTTHRPSWFAGLLGKAGPSRDGRSRLFLDGPRFTVNEGTEQKNYRLPATCRQCEDAICLIGCPVGSIHKGDHGEIIIQDWCIGCSRCAMQCPYGSIQMHTVGLVPRRSHGWQVARGDGAPWRDGATPFRAGRLFDEAHPGAGAVQFRRRFDLPGHVARESESYRLELLTAAPHVAVWVNGVQVVDDAATGPRKVLGQRDDRYTIEALLGLRTRGPAPAEAQRKDVLRAGGNDLLIRLDPPPGEGDALLDLGLYAYSKPVVDPGLVDRDEYDQELVMSRAVVCDLCGGSPACVSACPHDAAHRVPARSFFKLG